jgi:hypothetical protein
MQSAPTRAIEDYSGKKLSSRYGFVAIKDSAEYNSVGGRETDVEQIKAGTYQP